MADTTDIYRTITVAIETAGCGHLQSLVYAAHILDALDPHQVGYCCTADDAMGVDDLHHEQCDPAHTADRPVWVLRGVR